MNPILLKPEADSRSQIILRGQVWDTLPARDYYSQRGTLWKEITGCLDKLKKRMDLVILEGAGSPVELNLREHDIVNLAVAKYAGAPCLLVGDIDRGGIFAQLLGTLDLLKPDERKLMRGLIVNKFRGDEELFKNGIRMLEQRGRMPVLGVLPYLHDHGIPEEDAAMLQESPPSGQGLLDVVVIHLPHISNFDDFDPLRYEPGVILRFVDHIERFGNPDVIFLPGTKNTLGDLQWLYDSGFAEAIRQSAGKGASVVGFCGGFQMLGSQVSDELGMESRISQLPGLGLLPVITRMEQQKTVTRSRARISLESGFFKEILGEMVTGYEIHLGQIENPHPLIEIVEREDQAVSSPDGACSPDGKVWGCHLHGLLDNDNLRRAWLRSLGVAPAPTLFNQLRQQAYDDLADVLESSLDIETLDRILMEGI